MAYPFLTVNTCNCTATTSSCNNGCNDNCTSSPILSSNIVYNGPALTCTTIEPCNTLNIVLQKIDAVICELETEVNSLNEFVLDISAQLLLVNNNITSINNTLDVCCNGGTTTTTTTNAPTTTTTTTNAL